jgi:hypothetical protein
VTRLLLLGALFVPAAAAAHEQAWQTREDNAAYRAECGACHIAFPPALLWADDWLAITSDLEHHFGANAGLDAEVRKQISGFLERNGAANRAFASREDSPRITTADWFIRKHRGAMRLVLKGRVKSIIDCGACHKGPEIEGMAGG